MLHSSDFFQDADDFPAEAPGRVHRPKRVPDYERIARLVQLSPLDALRTRLLLDFGFGEDGALCFALRQDPAIDLSDDTLFAVIDDVFDTELGNDEIFAFDDPDVDDIAAETLAFLHEVTLAAASPARRTRGR